MNSLHRQIHKAVEEKPAYKSIRKFLDNFEGTGITKTSQWETLMELYRTTINEMIEMFESEGLSETVTTMKEIQQVYSRQNASFNPPTGKLERVTTVLGVSGMQLAKLTWSQRFPGGEHGQSLPHYYAFLESDTLFIVEHIDEETGETSFVYEGVFGRVEAFDLERTKILIQKRIEWFACLVVEESSKGFAVFT